MMVERGWWRRRRGIRICVDATIVGADAVERETVAGVDIGSDADAGAGGRTGDDDRTGADTGAKANA